MSELFRPARIVGGSVIAERDAFAFEATARYHGAEVFDGPLRARRVVVREPHQYIVGEKHFIELFQGTVAQTLALAGTAAPQIVHVLGRDGVAHALVEEELVGVTLDEVLRELRTRGGELPVEAALAIAAALVGLWRIPDGRGLLVPLHIGPAEIVVTPTGDIRARPELANDRARQAVGAMVHAIEPHIAYLSPEQVDGRLDETSGMFTLGLILYELLTNQHPIADPEQTSLMDILSQLRKADLPSILERRPIPPRLVAFLERLTARNTRARFESWDELMVQLDAVLAELPPCGSAQILDALPRRPAVPPELEREAFANWRSLPHDGLVPIEVELAPRARPDTFARPVLAQDFVYGRDGRPMLAHGRLRVDVRPVSTAEYSRFTLATRRASFPQPRDDIAATHVSFDDACAYAQWAGKRLPTEAEWASAVAAIGASRLGVGVVWEWTTTPELGGHVVRGGRWRNAPYQAALADNRSYETGPAPDVGFRCVSDA